MRFLLRNTVRDPRTLQLRLRNPGKVLQRPVLDGAPLIGTRILRPHEITPKLLEDIDSFSAVGNVEFLAEGKAGGIVDTVALRKKLWGEPVVQEIEASAPEVPSGSPAPREELVAPTEDAPASPPAEPPQGAAQENPAEGTPAVEEPTAAEKALAALADPWFAAPAESTPPGPSEEPSAEPVASPAPPVEASAENPAPPTTREELEALSYADLKAYYADLGGTPGKKSKVTMIEDILAGMG